jgi:hypothetical protein
MIHHQLTECAGEWSGTNILLDPMNGIAEESAAEATITEVIGARFLRIDYRWAYHEQPQEGSLLIGSNAKTGLVNISWADTWHMGHSIMNLTGEDAGAETLDARGTYEVGDGSPDWGWRIMIERVGPDDLLLVMNNIDPEGNEYLAVQARLERI